MDKVGTVRKEIHNGPKDADGNYEEETGWSLWILTRQSAYNVYRKEFRVFNQWQCIDSTHDGNLGAVFAVGLAIETNPVVGRIVRFDEGETIYGPPIGPGMGPTKEPEILKTGIGES